MKPLLIFIALFISVQMFAQNKKANAVFPVDGVCGMCKQRIEKACFDTKGVRYASWDIDTKHLTLIFNERKTSVEKVKKNIAAVGHDTHSCKAADEAYDGLHACCKYREQEVLDKHQPKP